MSKLYSEYLRLKENDSSKLYLFRNGNFYIFLDKDCDFINDFVVLKKTKFTKDVFKCGFPISSLDSYLRVFRNHKLNIEIIDCLSSSNIIDYINSIDIDNITPIDALNKLRILKELVK